MPLISVIIPAYNSEQTIQETIQSVINQTFTDWELIVINDGSTDSTSAIVEAFGDRRIQLFSYPNAGASVSRNRGLAKSTGELIAFLDADDLWTADKLQDQLAALQANRQADVAYSWSDCIDESSNFLRHGGRVTIEGNALPKLLLGDVLENGSNPLIRRKTLLEIGGFDESLPAGQDWDLYLRLAAKYQFVTVPRSQIRYRTSSRAMSANVRRLETANLQVIERAFDSAPASLQNLKCVALGNLYKYLIFKALEGSPQREKGAIALRFLQKAIANDLTLLKTRAIFKVILKALIFATLPTQQAEKLLTQSTAISNLNSLLGYIKSEV